MTTTITPEQLKVLAKAADMGLLKKQTGKRFAITGKLGMTRENVVKLINACEGRWDERVTWGTHYLIVGTQAYHGRWTTKMQAARDMRVEVITEDEFVAMLMPS